MFFGDLVGPSYSMYKDRRESLIKEIIKSNSSFKNSDLKNGLVLLFADFEKCDNASFYQDSTFYYFSGLKESGLALAIEFEEEHVSSTLFVPNCVQERKKWLGSAIEATQEDAELFYFEKINFLGDKINSLFLDRYFDKEVYINILSLVSGAVKSGKKIFVLNSKNNIQCFDQKFILDRLKLFLSEISVDLDKNIIDISDIIAKMRRKKDLFEIGKISEAINLTAMSHESGVKEISGQAIECEVQAAIEYIFTVAGGKRAYCTIVAGGKNSTILHYSDNSDQLNDGELVVIDAGAKLDGYCADITRTYPVSGSFTERQKEVYNIVLEAQKYISGIAKPGYYLNNSEYPDKCLTCLTKEFFKAYGLDKYFIHGIGHFLGLDVHDVGDLKSSLQEGDVITIEPGIYIPEESIGIRIEDNYWITENKAICLSDIIPKELEDVCEFMKNGFKQEQE